MDFYFFNNHLFIFMHAWSASTLFKSILSRFVVLYKCTFSTFKHTYFSPFCMQNQLFCYRYLFLIDLFYAADVGVWTLQRVLGINNSWFISLSYTAVLKPYISPKPKCLELFARSLRLDQLGKRSHQVPAQQLFHQRESRGAAWDIWDA